jgi:hypothetical protein
VSFSFFFIIIMVLLQLLYSVFIFDLVVAVDWIVKADELFCRPQKKKKMNNLSQLFGLREWCETRWPLRPIFSRSRQRLPPELVLVIVNTKGGIKINESSNSE